MYTIAKAGSDAKLSPIVWVYPPNHYEKLRALESATVQEVPGVGDAAYTKEERNIYRLIAMKKGRATIEITSDRREHLVPLARLVLETLEKRESGGLQ